jgi:hypothetical protein
MSARKAYLVWVLIHEGGGLQEIPALLQPVPTWVPLYDVDNSHDRWAVPTSEYSQYTPPPSGGSDDGILISHDFSEGPHPAFSGSFGTFVEWTSTSLQIANRTHTQHCRVVDLKYVRHCLKPDSTLLLTARVFLTKDGKVDQTDCAKGAGENTCMSIYQARMSSKAVGRTSSLWKEARSFGSMLGEVTTIALELN